MAELDDIQKYFPDISSLRAGQEPVIDAVMKQQDVIAVMPTGSGKSLCFQYPAARADGLTIVVSPLIALMEDQVREVTEQSHRKVKAACLNSRTSLRQYREILQGVKRHQYRLIYTSPEHLSSPKFIRLIRDSAAVLSHLVVDEAHCISMWGYDFRPNYLNIRRFLSAVRQRPPIACFSATATREIVKDISRVLQLHHPAEFYSCDIPENLVFSVRRCADEKEKLNIIRGILHDQNGKTGIIYCTTVKQTKELYETLRNIPAVSDHYQVGCYYSDCPGKQKAYRIFMKPSEAGSPGNLMTATSAFGMGINRPDVRFVIHASLPLSLEDYYQQCGRAGRDGKISRCFLLYDPEDIETGKIFSDNSRQMQGIQAVFAACGIKGSEAQIAEERNRRRFRSMVSLAENSAEKTGKVQNLYLHQELKNYFDTARPLDERELALENTLLEKAGLSEKDIGKSAAVPDALYTAESKLSHIIRNGTYQEREEGVLSASSGKGHPVRYLISTRLTYFDMMTADAVYTLQFFGADRIYPGNIARVLSGDWSLGLRPAGDGKQNLQAAIQESLERLTKTDIQISWYEYGKKHLLEGRFLPALPVRDGGWYLRGKMPLYTYSELRNELFSIPRSMLYVLKQDKDKGYRKVPCSVENLKLRHYLARRVVMAQPHSSVKQKTRRASTRILFVQQDPRRKSMFEILGLELPDDPDQEKRKRKSIANKTDMILTSFERANAAAGRGGLTGHIFLTSRNSRGMYRSVDLHYSQIQNDDSITE